MGHPATVMVLARGTSRTVYPGACPAHPSASHRPRRRATPRTSLASHRLRQNHGDPPRLHDLDSCRFRCYNPIPSLASPGSSFHASSIFHTSPSLPCPDVHGSLSKGWISEIFGGTSTNPKATLLTLSSSSGRPTELGAVPAGFSDHATLPDTVEIYPHTYPSPMSEGSTRSRGSLPRSRSFRPAEGSR